MSVLMIVSGQNGLSVCWLWCSMIVSKVLVVSRFIWNGVRQQIGQNELNYGVVIVCSIGVVMISVVVIYSSVCFEYYSMMNGQKMQNCFLIVSDYSMFRLLWLMLLSDSLILVEKNVNYGQCGSQFVLNSSVDIISSSMYGGRMWCMWCVQKWLKYDCLCVL